MRRLKRGESLVVATHNQGKLREFEQLMAPFGLKAIPAAVLGLAEPAEIGTTLEENARLKALSACKEAGLVALADDSGLSVDALGGAPGVYSARWAGAAKDFRAAMKTIEDKLQTLGAAEPDQRKARFVAVLALAMPDGSVETFRGEVEGTLVWPPRGFNGFGYDPMFVPDGHSITFAEMSADAKHGWLHGGKGEGLSHRARAFASLAAAVMPQ